MGESLWNAPVGGGGEDLQQVRPMDWLLEGLGHANGYDGVVKSACCGEIPGECLSAAAVGCWEEACQQGECLGKQQGGALGGLADPECHCLQT